MQKLRWVSSAMMTSKEFSHAFSFSIAYGRSKLGNRLPNNVRPGAEPNMRGMEFACL